MRKKWMDKSLRSVVQDYKKRFNITLRDWLVHHQQDIVFDQCLWMGVKAYKNPCDAWIYQEILFEVKPDVVIEIGSMYGGSTLFLANLMDLMNHGEVISVDIDRAKYCVTHPRIHVVTGDSSSPEIVKEVSRLALNKRVLVIHDGGHTQEQVLKDMDAYWQFVPIGSYFIVEDGIMDVMDDGDSIGTSYPGPLAASEEFLKSNSSFEVDTTKERYLITYNPRGFLKRVK